MKSTHLSSTDDIKQGNKTESYFEKNLNVLIIKAVLKPILRRILKIEKNQENMVKVPLIVIALFI